MKKDINKKESAHRPDLMSGFTLAELLVSVFIISFVVVVVTTFEKDIFSLNFSLQSSLNAQIDARHVVKIIVSQLREASPSSLGAYPIAAASPTAVTFYSDLNNDGLKEQIRYFLSGTDVKEGIIVPSGAPITYNSANEKLSTIISGYVSSSTLPLFQYYPSSYTGTTAPLSQPIDIPSIRLIRINVLIDTDPARSPGQMIITSQVSLRNLKDNL